MSNLSTERHYKPQEVAEMWSMSHVTVRRMFRDEPGVLTFGTEETRGKRRYMSMRIPQTVLDRVSEKLRS
jgi:hypothetical protein